MVDWALKINYLSIYLASLIIVDYPHNELIPSGPFAQVNSGFLHEDDMRIVIRQIRDRVMQVKRERERRVEMGSQQSINSGFDSISSAQQMPQGVSSSALQQQQQQQVNRHSLSL